MRKEQRKRKTKNNKKKIKKLIKVIMEITLVMIFVRTIEMGNIIKLTQYRETHNNQWGF